MRFVEDWLRPPDVPFVTAFVTAHLEEPSQFAAGGPYYRWHLEVVYSDGRSHRLASCEKDHRYPTSEMCRDVLHGIGFRGRIVVER